MHKVWLAKKNVNSCAALRVCLRQKAVQETYDLCAFPAPCANALGVWSAAGINIILTTSQTRHPMVPKYYAIWCSAFLKRRACNTSSAIQYNFSLFKWMGWKSHCTESHRDMDRRCKQALIQWNWQAISSSQIVRSKSSILLVPYSTEWFLPLTSVIAGHYSDVVAVGRSHWVQWGDQEIDPSRSVSLAGNSAMNVDKGKPEARSFAINKCINLGVVQNNTGPKHFPLSTCSARACLNLIQNYNNCLGLSS